MGCSPQHRTQAATIFVETIEGLVEIHYVEPAVHSVSLGYRWVVAKAPRPMLATAGELPAGPGWAYELKWDGIRALAVHGPGRLRLYARSGAEVTRAYPELQGLSGALTAGGLDEAVLDGEVVLLDERAIPSFSGLAERMHIRNEARAARLAADHPVTYMVFDIVAAGGNSLLRVPYVQRRSLLETVLPEAVVPQPALPKSAASESVPPESVPPGSVPPGSVPPGSDSPESVLADSLGAPASPERAPRGRGETAGYPRWMVPPYFTDGVATLAAAASLGLEGVVAKRLSSPYRPGVRSPDWVKVKHEQTVDLVVGGWRRGQRELGALLVGAPGPGGLQYRGRVGGGISAAAARDLLQRLEGLRARTSPFATPLPREDARGAIFCRPELVVEVRYGAITSDGKLRFPRLVRVRPDKPPSEAGNA